MPNPSFQPTSNGVAVVLDPIEAVRLKLERNALKYPVGPSRGRAEPPT